MASLSHLVVGYRGCAGFTAPVGLSREGPAGHVASFLHLTWSPCPQLAGFCLRRHTAVRWTARPRGHQRFVEATADY
jgi:hypothetical protein